MKKIIYPPRMAGGIDELKKTSAPYIANINNSYYRKNTKITIAMLVKFR